MGVARRRWLLLGTAAAAALGAPVLARPPRPLVVWFTVEGAKGLRRVGERFAAETGVPVVVETPDPMDGPTKFQQASAAGQGPDLYVFAHDRIGEWADAGILHAVEPDAAVAADIDPLAWQGFTLRGRTWGYPFAIEAVTLLHDRAAVPVPPTDFEAVFALDGALRRQAGRRAILWDYTNPYYAWPLLAAHGGYAFRRRADGSFDGRDTGLDHPGALPGAQLLERLLRQGLMPAGSGYAEMEAALAQRRVAMAINGPWAWVNLQRAGVDFGVARIPAVAGRPAAPFVGLKGFLVNRATRQRELAAHFVERFVLAPDGLREIDRAEPIGAPASRAYAAELRAHPVTGPRIDTILASARDGQPTPTNPEMGRFWSALKSALTSLSEGRQSPQQALATAAARVRQG